MGMNGHLSNARRHVQDQSTRKKSTRNHLNRFKQVRNSSKLNNHVTCQHNDLSHLFCRFNAMAINFHGSKDLRPTDPG